MAGLKEFILMKAQIFSHKDGVNSIDYETIAFVFNSLPDDDSFLHLVVDLHCLMWTEEFHSEMEKKGPHLEQLPAAFLAKTIGVLVKKRKIDDMHKGSCMGEIKILPRRHAGNLSRKVKLSREDNQQTSEGNVRARVFVDLHNSRFPIIKKETTQHEKWPFLVLSLASI